MTNETEPRTRRFYVDTSPEQEKVLLKKANHFFCRKRGLPESKSELTIELFQQLVDLLATAWKERHKVLESFGQQGVRIVRDLATPAAAAAAAATPAAESPAANKGRRPRVPMSEVSVQMKRARLREAADILLASIDEMSGVLAMTGANGGPADADEVLSAVCTYASAKIKRVDRRLPLTVDMVPASFARRIARELQCEYRFQHMREWADVKYATTMTQEVLQRLKKCFPRGMLPTWAEIEAFASKELSTDLEFTRAFLTNSIGIQFGPLASIKKFISEAFLRYEAGFQKGIVKSMKPGERLRVIVVAGVDGFNCKHFVSPLVGGYLPINIMDGGAKFSCSWPRQQRKPLHNL